MSVAAAGTGDFTQSPQEPPRLFVFRLFSPPLPHRKSPGPGGSDEEARW